MFNRLGMRLVDEATVDWWWGKYLHFLLCV